VTDRVLDEVGYYLLAGAGGEGPATLMDEARRGEELGFGTAFISERWNVKEASSLVGAACAVTTRMQIATAATNHNTRHPLITGSWATTMHRLSGGRFTLGIGRGVAAMYAAFGVPSVTTAQMEDFAQVMRRLWNGEVIFNHDGPIGKYQVLFLDPDFKENIRLALVAFGPNTLALGGRAFDDVILHTYFTPDTLQRCVKTVKDAAEKAGRDPDSVRVVVVLRHRRRPPAGGTAAQEDRRPTGDLPAGLRRPDGADQQLGSHGAATLSGRFRRHVDPRRDRPQGHAGADRAHRHLDPRRVA
jgi:probable F420-dependent oxidoreductase